MMTSASSAYSASWTRERGYLFFILSFEPSQCFRPDDINESEEAEGQDGAQHH